MTTQPTVFKRGTSFRQEVVFPDDVADGQFTMWLPLAQMRPAPDVSGLDFTQELSVVWEDSTLARKLIVTCDNTDDWPVGLLQMDVLMTSASGKYYRTPVITFDCQPGVTEVMA